MAKIVQLASGKKAYVGTTSRMGKYDYTVQADGSVKRSDGKITAKPTNLTIDIKPPKAPVAKPAAAAAPKKQVIAPVPMARDARPKAAAVAAVSPAAPKGPVNRGGLKPRAATPVVEKPKVPFTKGGNAGPKTVHNMLALDITAKEPKKEKPAFTKGGNTGDKTTAGAGKIKTYIAAKKKFGRGW